MSEELSTSRAAYVDARTASVDWNSTHWDATTSTVETTSVNYWPEFGKLQYFEFSYIIFLIVFGTFGNSVVIFSIVLSKKVHLNGNIFIINLALADLSICMITLPTVAANILGTRNTLPKVACDVVGYIVTATCACSLTNLSLVAFNRYWAVVRYASYRRRFTSALGISLAVATWAWSLLLVSPCALGWGSFTFDAKALVCAWDDSKNVYYSIFLIGLGVVLPLLLIAFSYFKVFSTVQATGKWRRHLRTAHNQNAKPKRLSTRERSLLRTLLATVVAFCICWTPYAVHVMIDPANVTPHLKKFLVWLAFSNSCVNFIIYGVLNPSFKRGYKRLFYFVFRCFKDVSVSLPTRTAWSSGGPTMDRSGIQMASLSPQGNEPPSMENERTDFAVKRTNELVDFPPENQSFVNDSASSAFTGDGIISRGSFFERGQPHHIGASSSVGKDTVAAPTAQRIVGNGILNGRTRMRGPGTEQMKSKET